MFEGGWGHRSLNVNKEQQYLSMETEEKKALQQMMSILCDFKASLCTKKS